MADPSRELEAVARAAGAVKAAGMMEKGARADDFAVALLAWMRKTEGKIMELEKCQQSEPSPVEPAHGK